MLGATDIYFLSKGNKQQFVYAARFETSKEALNGNATEKTKKAVAEGISLVSKIMKVIKTADKSDYSWAIVEELLYLSGAGSRMEE